MAAILETDEFHLKSVFSKADLREAYMYEANLTGANLLQADLNWTNLNRANLSFAIFKPNLLQATRNIAFANNLLKMRFIYSRQALTELREELKKAGLRREEREVNYAINPTQRRIL